MNKSFLIVSAIIIIFLTDCSPKHQPYIITKKIQYDVNIKSPDPEYDWWIQNLVGPQREKIVDMIINDAKTGKVKAYDYFFKPITTKAVAAILSDTTTLKMERNKPPYEIYDTTIVYNIRKTDIQRLRFMEEWRINPKTLQFEKIIKGIAPIARRVDAEGKVRWQPLFWIFTDNKFVKSLQQ